MLAIQRAQEELQALDTSSDDEVMIAGEWGMHHEDPLSLSRECLDDCQEIRGALGSTWPVGHAEAFSRRETGGRFGNCSGLEQPVNRLYNNFVTFADAECASSAGIKRASSALDTARAAEERRQQKRAQGAAAAKRSFGGPPRAPHAELTGNSYFDGSNLTDPKPLEARSPTLVTLRSSHGVRF